MFEQAFKRIDDTLRKDAGVSSELDYIEQTSWILFLKYLDQLESDKAAQAELDGKKYTPLLEAKFRWTNWATPRTPDGKPDLQNQLIGNDLRDFVDQQLFPYLKNFKARADDARTLEYKVGEIFGELKNKVQSGYNLREIIEEVDTLTFNSQKEKHELSDLYEAKIRSMGNAGRNGGEYYTPRPLIRAMLAVVQPKIGETIYDGALGSAGFLCESFERLSKEANTVKKAETLQRNTFFGQEKKPLAYVIGLMNMILHGIEAPNIIHVNTLETNLNDIEERDRHDIILANPPFGGRERVEVQQNFPIKTSETAFLFLQHFIRKLKAGGRAGIVIKNTFLSNTDNASISLRKKLVEDTNLHSILSLPRGTFTAGVQTVVLFFEKGSSTRKIWYYKVSAGRNLGKTNPLNDADLEDFTNQEQNHSESAHSWCVDRMDIDSATYDLTVKNPNDPDDPDFKKPIEILEELTALDTEVQETISAIKGML